MGEVVEGKFAFGSFEWHVRWSQGVLCVNVTGTTRNRAEISPGEEINLAIGDDLHRL